jgi:hypothetical protein
MFSPSETFWRRLNVAAFEVAAMGRKQKRDDFFAASTLIL